jgi:hypothetical protein
MIDPGFAAVLASLVSLALGLASIFRTSRDEREIAKREQVQRRAEAYLDLLRLVERRGLATQDDMYNLTETEDEDSFVKMPQRVVDAPPRSDRAEALALVVAYGTSEIRSALDRWLDVLDQWDSKRAGFVYEEDLNGPRVLTPEDAEPERGQEITARRLLGESVGIALK